MDLRSVHVFSCCVDARQSWWIAQGSCAIFRLLVHPFLQGAAGVARVCSVTPVARLCVLHQHLPVLGPAWGQGTVTLPRDISRRL